MLLVGKVQSQFFPTLIYKGKNLTVTHLVLRMMEAQPSNVLSMFQRRKNVGGHFLLTWLITQIKNFQTKMLENQSF